jgi:hypothetical protein
MRFPIDVETIFLRLPTAFPLTRTLTEMFWEQFSDDKYSSSWISPTDDIFLEFCDWFNEKYHADIFRAEEEEI